MLEKFLERKLSKLGYVKQEELPRSINYAPVSTSSSTWDEIKSLNRELSGLKRQIESLPNQDEVYTIKVQLSELAESVGKLLNSSVKQEPIVIERAIANDNRELETSVRELREEISYLKKNMLSNDSVEKRLKEAERMAFNADKKATSYKNAAEKLNRRTEESVEECIEKVGQFTSVYNAMLGANKTAGKVNTQKPWAPTPRFSQEQ